MIAAAAFLPHPPLLLPEYASLGDPGADLRGRCLGVLAGMAELGVREVILLTGTERHPPAISTRPPLGLRVGRDLLARTDALRERAQVMVPFDADHTEVAAAARALVDASSGPAVGVLVLGDGSARRGEKAPGHLDERAFGFDEGVRAALAAGDLAALRDLDAGLADELLAAGRAAWQVLAAAVGERPRVLAAEALDPFGVLYHFALWAWEPVDG